MRVRGRRKKGGRKGGREGGRKGAHAEMNRGEVEQHVRSILSCLGTHASSGSLTIGQTNSPQSSELNKIAELYLRQMLSAGRGEVEHDIINPAATTAGNKPQLVHLFFCVFPRRLVRSLPNIINYSSQPTWGCGVAILGSAISTTNIAHVF